MLNAEFCHFMCHMEEDIDRLKIPKYFVCKVLLMIFRGSEISWSTTPSDMNGLLNMKRNKLRDACAVNRLPEMCYFFFLYAMKFSLENELVFVVYGTSEQFLIRNNMRQRQPKTKIHCYFEVWTCFWHRVVGADRLAPAIHIFLHGINEPTNF